MKTLFDMTNASYQKLSDLIEAEKATFAKVISDKTYSLEDRWATFVNAPDFLKNHECFAHEFKALDRDDICYEGRLVHCERYSKVTWDRVVTGILECGDFYKTDEDYESGNLCQEGIDIYNAVREEILENNIGSFEYDW